METQSANPYASSHVDAESMQAVVADDAHCTRCGGELVEGTVENRLYFRPNLGSWWANFFNVWGSILTIRGRACLECGALETNVDPHRLRKAVKKQ